MPGPRFKPGNPGGKHSGPGIRATYDKRHIMDATISPEDWRTIFWIQAKKAMKGDTAAAKFVTEHRWGKPAQDLNLGNQEGDGGFQIVIAPAVPPSPGPPG